MSRPEYPSLSSYPTSMLMVRQPSLPHRLFVLFNLYCPNETNETRLPYKLNYLYALQSRICHLLSKGRNVIVLGDINVCHRPIDNGEGGIQRNAEEHFDHPARKWFDKWVWDEDRGTGVLHDVTRERYPKRKGMFTCGFKDGFLILQRNSI